MTTGGWPRLAGAGPGPETPARDADRSLGAAVIALVMGARDARQPGPLAREALRDPRSDASARPADQRDFSFYSKIHSVPLSIEVLVIC